MIFPKKPQFVKLKTELMGRGPNDDDKIGYSDLPSLYHPISFCISWFQTVIKKIFKQCNNCSLVTLNWLDGRNLSRQVCTLLQRRNRTWGKLQSKSARKGFSFSHLCLTNRNSGCLFCLTCGLSLSFLFIYSEMLSNGVVEVKVKILRLLKWCKVQLF